MACAVESSPAGYRGAYSSGQEGFAHGLSLASAWVTLCHLGTWGQLLTGWPCRLAGRQGALPSAPGSSVTRRPPWEKEPDRLQFPSLPPPSCVTWASTCSSLCLSFPISKMTQQQQFLPCATTGRIRKQEPQRADWDACYLVGTQEMAAVTAG